MFNREDKYFRLSNFAGYGFVLDGNKWRTMEHYFQAMKFEGTPQFDKTLNCGSPKQAKDLGQSRAIPIRQDWDLVKEEIMLKGLREKFKDSELRNILLGTGKKELVENSPYDKYWGIGPNGKGKNRLGVLLMQLRAEIKESNVKKTAALNALTSELVRVQLV
ncbi:NADAR family protein [Pseudoalteromonas luteoviolacea]|uniref:NADAR family protein n=1 Tax=Pseudoalteromonas luteoviolacea TaxID=43657 RepID=UPI001B3A192A|nr:NADAR family protein [Pseudoalteromonas luteoviolacea]MBQ4909661.1 NADAR family protein [Pseudoalteromonas luteoviolacea]